MANIKETSIKYINKDFEGFKRDLMRYSQAHFSGSYQDYNETSPGMMILELQAYIGDVLAFYMDQQFLETKAATSQQIENIEDYAKMRGYKPKGKRSSRVKLDFIVEVPEKDGAPDSDYLPILKAGSQAQSKSGITFETVDDLDFAKSTTDNPQQIVSVPSDGGPRTVAVRRWVEAVAGSTTTETFDIGDFVPFFRQKLGSTQVQDVLSITDLEGNQWFEVDYLAQNSVFDQITNSGDDSNAIPYILKLRSTPRRFVVEKSVSGQNCYLQFGGGEGLKFDDELVPNVANFAIPTLGKQQFTSYTIDPQNFLKTRTLGLSPHNTRLNVTYRVGGGADTNVPALTITKVVNANLTFGKSIGGGGLDQSLVDIVSRVEVFNLADASGGGDEETASEIKVNAASFFASQARAVTKEDFVAQILSMPERFGRVEKVFVNSKKSTNGIDIHLLTKDVAGKFAKSTDTLKKNVKTFIKDLRMLTSGISIFDTSIINVSLNFGVVVSPKYNRSEVLTNCISILKDYFKNDNMQVGMPIVFSDVKAQLQAVDGVISVYKFDVELKRGELDSTSPYVTDINFDVSSNTRNGIVYCPPNAIFEVRYPDNDIVGESK